MIEYYYENYIVEYYWMLFIFVLVYWGGCGDIIGDRVGGDF